MLHLHDTLTERTNTTTTAAAEKTRVLFTPHTQRLGPAGGGAERDVPPHLLPPPLNPQPPRAIELLTVDPSCLTMMAPALIGWPPYCFTPRRLLFESRPFLVEPAPFLCAFSTTSARLGMANTMARLLVRVRPARALRLASIVCVLLLRDSLLLFFLWRRPHETKT